MNNKRKAKKTDDTPLEMKISRRPVYSQTQILDTKKFVRRDPRFEASSGTFDEKKFEKNYEFIKDMRKSEKEELEKHAKQVDDEERKAQISYLLNRLTNQEKAEEMKEKRKKNLEKIREEKGRKVYVNKCKTNLYDECYISSVTAQMKKIEIVEKFKELKRSSKLQKYMERKRKKNTYKDRKKFTRK